MNHIDKANYHLKTLYGSGKHIPISPDDLESIYSGDRPLLSIGADPKTKKGVGSGYLTGILYLAASNISGYDVCPKASNGCRKACLLWAGRGHMYGTMKARLTRTVAYLTDRNRFEAAISADIVKLKKKAVKNKLIPCVRLNGTSDIVWERKLPKLFERFSDIQFYDYTKIPTRFRNTPSNYYLTFSLSESNENEALEVFARGGNIAVVFRNKLPESFNTVPVINGDEHDLRFLDRPVSVVGLIAKGRAKKDESGFVKEPL